MTNSKTAKSVKPSLQEIESNLAPFDTDNPREVKKHLTAHPVVVPFLPALISAIKKYCPDSKPIIDVYADKRDCPEKAKEIMRLRIRLYQNDIPIPQDDNWDSIKQHWSKIHKIVTECKLAQDPKLKNLIHIF